MHTLYGWCRQYRYSHHLRLSKRLSLCLNLPDGRSQRSIVPRVTLVPWRAVRYIVGQVLELRDKSTKYCLVWLGGEEPLLENLPEQRVANIVQYTILLTPSSDLILNQSYCCLIILSNIVGGRLVSGHLVGSPVTATSNFSIRSSFRGLQISYLFFVEAER